jgi:peptidoglycan hydrolase CwlO-like protein
MSALDRHGLRLRCTAATLLIAGALAALPATASPSVGDLQSKISSDQGREGALQSSIQSDSGKIGGFQGSIDDLQKRQDQLQSVLDVERNLLLQTQDQLRKARARLVVLRGKLAADKIALAQQLVAQYKSPQADIVTVVIQARGFADLLERVDQLKRVARANAAIAVAVDSERRSVATQVAQLAQLEARRQRVATAMLVQRDEVARLRLAVVAKQMVFVRARNRKAAQLGALRQERRTLEHRLATIQVREAAAQSPDLAPGGVLGPTLGAGSFSAHGGSTGFFPAPGTNYSVGQEPTLAAHLDALGKALGLHLIGISGYRTPQHSVEVGGFANDPHTRGQASDTPGVEGVSEATLNRFGLTRPFGGAAEADHIQLVGSM